MGRAARPREKGVCVGGHGLDAPCTGMPTRVPHASPVAPLSPNALRARPLPPPAAPCCPCSYVPTLLLSLSRGQLRRDAILATAMAHDGGEGGLYVAPADRWGGVVNTSPD